MTDQTETTLHFVQTRLGEAVIPEANRSAFERIDSPTLFDRHFGDLFRQRDTLFVVVGSDSGLLAAWIREGGFAPGSRYLFIEPDPIAALLADTYPTLFDGEQLILSTRERWQTLDEVLNFSDYAYLENVRVVPSIGANDGHLLQYREILDEVTRKTDLWQHEVALEKGRHAFLVRQIENIPDNLLPASVLRQQFAGLDAVLLAGGPSLHEILPWVKQHRERLVVLAVSRIARQLLAAEIVPDLVFHIDPHPVSFDVSREALMFSPGTILVCGHHAYPGIQAQWPGPVLHTGDRFPWRPDHDNLRSHGPNVTNQTFATAIAMGFSRIILGGVDLCHDRHGYSYAPGSDEHARGPALAGDGPRVRTYGGWMADTTHLFLKGIEILDSQAELAARAGCEVINPAPGAAVMRHVRHVPLEEITLEDRPPRPSIDSLLARYTQAYRKQALDAGLQGLREFRQRLREVQKLCEQAIEWNARAYRPDGRLDMRYKKRLDRIEHKLEGPHAETTKLVKQMGLAAFLSLVRPDRWESADAEELKAWGERYYRIYADSALALIRLVDKAREDSQVRLEELQAEPDIDRLLAHWRANRIPGRVRFLQWLRPEVSPSLDDDRKARFESLLAEFDALMARQPSGARTSLQQTGNLAKVRSRLQWLFEQRKMDELKDVSAALGRLEDPVAKELYSLAKGYEAELLGMSDEALNRYQQVVDAACTSIEDDPEQRTTPGLEDALQRISTIALHKGDAQMGLGALEALSSLCPAYQPQYAELLRLCGRIQEAADLYTEYLSRAPEDLATMLKLGKLFHEAGALDSARQAYRYVLGRSPANKAARTLIDSLPKEVNGA